MDGKEKKTDEEESIIELKDNPTTSNSNEGQDNFDDEFSISSNASEMNDDEEVLWQRKLNLAYGSDNQEEEICTKKPTTKSTSVAWGQKINQKFRNAPLPVIDPDAPR
eukprot:7757566-Ditylum_brightwellii.AAC.1